MDQAERYRLLSADSILQAAGRLPGPQVQPRVIPMTASPPTPDVADEVPWSDRMTEYDDRHCETYIRLLHAESSGLSRDDMAQWILGIGPHR